MRDISEHNKILIDLIELIHYFIVINLNMTIHIEIIIKKEEGRIHRLKIIPEGVDNQIYMCEVDQ